MATLHPNILSFALEEYQISNYNARRAISIQRYWSFFNYWVYNDFL